MPTFSGVDHFSLSVTDLDRSETFYTTILGFMRLMDFGDARALLHRPTGFMIALVRHPAGTGQEFTELNTGLDHIGLITASRDELVEWAERLKSANVPYTPIRDMPFGHHLNFRDPDNIPLELYAPDAFMTEAMAELRERDLSPDEITARAQEQLDAFA